MRKYVAVGILLTPGGMIGPGHQARPEVMDLAFVTASAQPDQPHPRFSELVRPADLMAITKFANVMEPEDIQPGTAVGDLIIGLGTPLPVVLEKLDAWWKANLGTDGYSGSARPCLVAHDAFVVRQRLKEHLPLIDEWFHGQIDLASLQAVIDPDADPWQPRQWRRAEDAAFAAWDVLTGARRRMLEPAQP